MLDGFDILKQFIPLHKRIEMKDHIVDVLSKAVPDDRWHKLIQTIALMLLFGKHLIEPWCVLFKSSSLTIKIKYLQKL